MTPDERAKDLIERCRSFDIGGDPLFIACDLAESLIASAIREAENEALERAAQQAETYRRSTYGPIGGYPTLIRSLKHTKE